MTDTNKWRKPFIRGLNAAYKLLWFYILDDCDHAGIWIVDFEVAGIRIGEDVNEAEALELFESKIQVFDNGERWFIPDFIDFQYGELNPENRAHNSVIKQLSKYSLNINKPLISPLQGASKGAKDKDKDKDKDKVKDKDKSRKKMMKNSDISVQDVKESFEKTSDLKNADYLYYYNSALDWSDAKGAMAIDWIATIRNFARRDLKDGKMKLRNKAKTGTNQAPPIPADYGKKTANDMSLEEYRKSKERKGGTSTISEILKK